jgi:putative FmdB family regulatory protein
MPLYDFRCPQCEHAFEIRRSFSEDGPVPCPNCQAETKQVYSVFSFGGRTSGPQSPMDKFKDSPRGKQYAAMADVAVNKVMKDIKERN